MSLFVSSFSFAFLSSLVGWGHAGGTDHEAGLSQQQSKPNIVFIITDDQDTLLDSLEYMPLLNKYMIDEGTLYGRHYYRTLLPLATQSFDRQSCPQHQRHRRKPSTWYAFTPSLTPLLFLPVAHKRVPKVHQPGLEQGLAPGLDER